MFNIPVELIRTAKRSAINWMKQNVLSKGLYKLRKITTALSRMQLTIALKKDFFMKSILSGAMK